MKPSHRSLSSSSLGFALSLALAGCGSATSPAAPGEDSGQDVRSESVSMDVPADGDVAVVCPTVTEAAVANGTPCSPDGAQCRYGYTRPECGGRTLDCVSGRWSETHTDPSSACFDAGPADTPPETGDAGTYPCGAETCSPSQYCVHACSGIDPGPDASFLRPACGTPSSCFTGSGMAIGRDYYCTGCV